MLVFYLVAARFSAIGWLQVAVASIVAIDLGFWFLEPQLEWYVGLSGLLHGLLAAGVVQGIRAGQIDFWVLGGLLLLKLVYEALFGPLPGSEASSGGSVVVAAHLYGAAGGALSGLYLSFRKDRQPPI